MKVKLFTKMNPTNHPEPANSEFEEEINDWLLQHPGVEIRHTQQSAGGGSQGPFVFFVSVWYEVRH